MRKRLALVVLVCLLPFGACSRRQLVALRVVDAINGEVLEGATAVQWHRDKIGLSFKAIRVTDATRTTNEYGTAFFPSVGKRDYIDIAMHGYRDATVGDFFDRRWFDLRSGEEDRYLDRDGRYRVLMYRSLPEH